MKSLSIRQLAAVALSSLVLSFGLVVAVGAGPASAQCNVTADNFSGTTFDVEGYLSASAACTAGGVPSVAVGSSLTVVVNGCAAGNTYAVRVQGTGGTAISGSGASTGATNTIVLALPATWTPGVTNVVATCTSGSTTVFTARRTISLVAAGTVGAVTSVEVGVQVLGQTVTAQSGGGTQLSVTGSETATIVAYGAALVLVGGAMVLGVRRRRSVGV